MSNNEEEGVPVETDPVLNEINKIWDNTIIPLNEKIRILNFQIIEKNKNFLVNDDVLEAEPNNPILIKKKILFSKYSQELINIQHSQQKEEFDRLQTNLVTISSNYKRTLDELKRLTSYF